MLRDKCDRKRRNIKHARRLKGHEEDICIPGRGNANADPLVGACLAYSRACKEDIVADSSEEEGKLLERRSERSRIQRPHPIGLLGQSKDSGFYSKWDRSHWKEQRKVSVIWLISRKISLVAELRADWWEWGRYYFRD